MMQTVTISDWLPTMSANGSHEHWSKAQKAHDCDRDTAWGSAKHAGWQRFDCKVRVTITLYFSQHRRRDIDNLHYRVKGVIDGIKYFCIDDDAEHMELVVAAQVPLIGGRKATEITMAAVP